MSPDAAVALMTGGVGLIYVELNRPGRIVPGMLGLTASLISVASLLRGGTNPVGITLVFAAIVLLGANVVRPISSLLATVATLCLIAGLWKLPVGTSGPVHLPVAIGCGLLLGGGTFVLTRIAWRARVNKMTV